MSGTVKKNQTAKIPTKSGNEYSYKYVDIAQIHTYLDSINARYIQQTKRIEGDDYIMTKRCFDGVWEDEWLQGVKVVDATLYGNDNPAQKQGSAVTYARRYSLLMAFGLATEDNDANDLNPNIDTKKPIKEPTEEDAIAWVFGDKYKKHAGEKMLDVLQDDEQYVQWYINNKASEYDKKCYELLTGEKLPTDSEMDERIKLQNKINELALETDTDFEEIHNYFKVQSTQQMTVKQLNECIKILEQKVFKKIVTEGE